MLKNFFDDRTLVDEADDAHFSLALGADNEFVPDRPIVVPGLKAPKLESTVDIEGTHESILAADQNYILPDVPLIIDPANNPSEDRIWVLGLLPR